MKMIRIPYLPIFLSALIFSGCSGDSERGSSVDSERVVDVDSADPEMNQAYEDARKSVSDFVAALGERKPGYWYLLKMRIEAEDEVEHIWVDSVSYKEGVFSGMIANEPYRITSMKMGDTVRSSADDISDWAILDDKDELTAGGFTIAVMEKKREAAE